MPQPTMTAIAIGQEWGGHWKEKQEKGERSTFSTGRVMQAVTMAARRRRRRERRKKEEEETAMDESLRRQGLQSSSSPPSIPLPCFRALRAPMFARFTTALLPFFFVSLALLRNIYRAIARNRRNIQRSKLGCSWARILRETWSGINPS